MADRVLDALDEAGCARYLVTDVARDGQLNGPNLQLLSDVSSRTPARLVASGGVSTAHDIVALARLATTQPNVDAAVVGTALLHGELSLADALAASRRS